jgi:hypothetical protein
MSRKNSLSVEFISELLKRALEVRGNEFLSLVEMKSTFSFTVGSLFKTP